MNSEFVSKAEKRLAEVKRLIGEARECLGELEKVDLDSEEAREAGNPRLRKIVGTSKNAFISRMNSLLSKISPPSATDFSSVRKYCLGAAPELQSELNAMGKNILYTGILLKSELKKFASILKELGPILSALHAELQENPRLQSALRAREELSSLISLQREMSELEEIGIPAARKSLESALLGIGSMKNELGSVSSSSEAGEHDSIVAEIERLREQKAILKQKFLQLISHVDKGLGRLSQQSESGKFILPKDRQSLLRNYVSNPFQALSSDKGAEGLVALLSELRGAMEKDLVEFKGDEKRRRLEAIETIVSSGSLESAFSEQAELEKRISLAEGRASKSGVRLEMESLKQRIAEAERLASEERASLARLEEMARSKSTEFSSRKESAERMLSEFSGSSVRISLAPGQGPEAGG